MLQNGDLDAKNDTIILGSAATGKITLMNGSWFHQGNQSRIQVRRIASGRSSNLLSYCTHAKKVGLFYLVKDYAIMPSMLATRQLK